MPTLKHSFLLIGPWDSRLSEIGAIVIPSLHDLAGRAIERVDVVGVTATTMLEKKFSAFQTALLQACPWAQFVAVVPEGVAAVTLLDIVNRVRPRGLLKRLDGPEVEGVLYQAQEAASRLRQERALEDLTRDQERRLESLRFELESRVEKRTRSLAESRHNLHLRGLRSEALRHALLAAQEAKTPGDMENRLSQAIAGSIEISWIRIVPGPPQMDFERQLKATGGFSWLAVPLWRSQERIGTAFFMRPLDRPFRREDQDFLHKVSEAVALALGRLNQIREAETLMEQWDATFAAIADRVAIIDADYSIVQSNQTDSEGRRCYDRLFGRDAPCEGCQRGQVFRIEHGGRVLEVHSQALPLDPEKEPFFVNLYNDVTERNQIERRLVETAKMAELGTIGSSIAHELNNPLGGILNFTQLLRMELPPEHPFHPDLAELENGARRCKEIIEHLLGFTRRPRPEEIGELDLREVARRAMKIVELRSKSSGVWLKANWPPQPCLVHGHLNLLSQALKNLLERAIDSVLARRQREPQHIGLIELDLISEDGNFSFLLRDDGDGEGSAAGRHGLALQISSRILHDAGAELETSAPSSPECWAKISFSRPVFGS